MISRRRKKTRQQRNVRFSSLQSISPVKIPINDVKKKKEKARQQRNVRFSSLQSISPINQSINRLYQEEKECSAKA